MVVVAAEIAPSCSISKLTVPTHQWSTNLLKECSKKDRHPLHFDL